MEIKIFEDRSYSKDYLHNEGTEFENKATTLHFTIPETLEGIETSSLNKYIVFDIEGNQNRDILTPENTYVLPSFITKLGSVKFNLYLIEPSTGAQNENLFVWVSKQISLNFNDAVQKKDVIISQEEIDIFNSLMTELNETIAEVNLLEADFQAAIVQVNNLNIDVSKTGSTATVTITNKEGVEKSVDIKDGTDYIITEQDYQNIANVVEQDIVPLIPTKYSDLTNDNNTVQDADYVHTDNNYTTEEKNKLAGLENYDDTEVKADISNLETNKADKSEIPDVSGFITKDVNNLTNYTLKTNTGSLIDLEINQSTYVVTLNLKDQDGTVISTDNIDLPLESVVVGGSYDSTNKKIVLTLENGNTVDIPVGDLVAGLQTEITSSNKLASDLVDDTNSGNKFTNTSEKNSWNAKYDKPNGGIPKTDLDSSVQTSLGKADTAIQSSDLNDYVKNTDYASDTVGGVIKVNNNSNGVFLGGSKNLAPDVIDYATYSNKSSYYFISKGTLENVITGKGLVSDTDYATSQKGGVIKIAGAYGFSIDSGGNINPIYLNNYSDYPSKSNNYAISKGTLETVITGKQLINQTTLNESQATQDEKIEKLKADHPPINETGTELTLEGTGDFDLSLSPKGNITQETTTGKNLWKLISPNSRDGVTLSYNDDGAYILNGTATANTSFYVTNVGYSGGYYTLSANNSSTNSGVILQLETSGGNRNFDLDTINKYLTVNVTDINVLTIVVNNGTVLNNFKFYPQLETGSTATTFEKYTGRNSKSKSKFSFSC